MFGLDKIRAIICIRNGNHGYSAKYRLKPVKRNTISKNGEYSIKMSGRRIVKFKNGFIFWDFIEEELK